MSSSSFPQEGPYLRQRLPSTGSARSRSPASQGLLTGSDFSRSFRRDSVAVATPYPDCVSYFAPHRHGRHDCAAWTICVTPPAALASNRGDPEISQVPVKPLCACPVLRPRRTVRASLFTARPMLPSAQKTTSAPRSVSFRGSITRPAHPLCTPRSRGHPRTTQHSVPAGRYTFAGAGLSPAGFTRRFRYVDSFYTPSSFSRLNLAHFPRKRVDVVGSGLRRNGNVQSGSGLLRFERLRVEAQFRVERLRACRQKYARACCPALCRAEPEDQK
jgi:hypothetical protein